MLRRNTRVQKESTINKSDIFYFFIFQIFSQYKWCNLPFLKSHYHLNKIAESEKGIQQKKMYVDPL